jgi:hypothetical protein
MEWAEVKCFHEVQFKIFEPSSLSMCSNDKRKMFIFYEMFQILLFKLIMAFEQYNFLFNMVKLKWAQEKKFTDPIVM